MERVARPALDHLKEVGWGIVLIDLVFLLLGLLFLPHLGAGLSATVFGALGVMVTAVIGGLAVLNVAVVLLWERWRRGRVRGSPP